MYCSDESHAAVEAVAAVAAVAAAATQKAILFTRALPFLTCYTVVVDDHCLMNTIDTAVTAARGRVTRVNTA